MYIIYNNLIEAKNDKTFYRMAVKVSQFTDLFLVPPMQLLDDVQNKPEYSTYLKFATRLHFH